MNLVIENTVNRGTATIQTGKFAGLEQFLVEQIRPATAPEDRPFRPASVSGPTGLLWTFQRDHQGFPGSAEFVEHDGEMFIVLVERKKFLALVLPVIDLPHLRRTNAGEWIGGRKLQTIISLKETIAEQMGLEPLWTGRESAMRKALTDDALAARRAEENEKRKAEEAARAEARRIKDERRSEIARRRRLHVFTENGDRRHGLPVVGDEWLVLTDGVYCVSVESFDSATGKAGKPIEAFEVKKENAKVGRKNVVSVTAETTHRNTGPASVTLEIKTAPVKIKGEYEDVVLAKDMDHVRALNSDHKLNSGTFVMAPKSDDPGRFAIFRLTGGKIESVGETIRKSAQK